MMVLVTGGSASGKSAYAEQVACALPAPRFYLATMSPHGAEAAARIERHRALRAGKGFATVECYGMKLEDQLEPALEAALVALHESIGTHATGSLSASRGPGFETRAFSEAQPGAAVCAGSDAEGESRKPSPRIKSAGTCASGASASRATAPPASGASASRATALLEDLGNVVANVLFSQDFAGASPEEVLEVVLSDVDAFARSFDNLVIVGNEVGCDGVRYDETTQAYIRVLGAAACAIAERCDVVIECVMGCPHIVKGKGVL